MSTWKQIHESYFKDPILTNVFFCLPTWIWKGRHNVKFHLPLSVSQCRQASGRAEFGRNSHHLPAFCLLSQDPVSRLWSEWGVPAGLFLVTRNCKGGIIILPFAFVGECLAETPFDLGTLSVDKLSSWEILHCGHRNSRFSLVKLICLFRLKTKFHLLEASHLTWSSLSLRCVCHLSSTPDTI